MEASQGSSPRWWSRQLPPVVDASFYGLFFTVGLVVTLWFWLTPLILNDQWPWVRAGGIMVGLAAWAVYVWFFEPVYRLLETELPLPGTNAPSAENLRRARNVASGAYLAWVLPAAVYPAIFVGTATASTITGDPSFLEWILVFASFVAFAVWGARILPSLRLARRVWARRLGRPPRASTRVVGEDVLGRTPFLGALLGVIVLVLLVAPIGVVSTVGALANRSKNGTQRWLDAGEVVRLTNGVELTAPAGWTARLTTGNPLEVKWGILESASLSSDSETEDGFIYVSVIGRDAPRNVQDPAAIAESAREHSREAYGPVVFNYRGWEGTAAVTQVPLNMQPEGTLNYDLWVRLQMPSGGGWLCISAGSEVLGVTDASQPVEMARRLIDFVELRLSDE